jgi:hypothetical protein
MPDIPGDAPLCPGVEQYRRLFTLAIRGSPFPYNEMKNAAYLIGAGV